MPSPTSERVPVLTMLVAAALIAVAGIATVLTRAGGSSGAGPRTRAAPVIGRAASQPLIVGAEARPLRIRIPAIRVDAPLVALGLNADGTLDVPRYQEAGWYSGGSRPGRPGPAVIAAHVDSLTGPAVFYRLEKLEEGDQVFVDYAEVTATFIVREADRVDKSSFPTERVYGPTPSPELRLVTCAGSFDRSTHSYAANLIVWGDLLEVA